MSDTAAPWRCRYGHIDCIVHPGVDRKPATAADSMCEACGCTDAAHGDEYGDNRTCPHDDCTGWFYV